LYVKSNALNLLYYITL